MIITLLLITFTYFIPVALLITIIDDWQACRPVLATHAIGKWFYVGFGVGLPIMLWQLDALGVV